MILQTERYPNAQRLAEACAVSRRTIYRDLATLEAAGIQVRYRADYQGYELARECLLRPLQLDDHEALALLILIRSSRADEPFGLARHARSALAKVLQVLPPELRGRITRCGELLADEPAPIEVAQPEQRAIDETILIALMDRRVLRVDLYDRTIGATFQTNLAPFRVSRIAGRWTLAGHSSFHGCAQIFDLGNIQMAVITEQTYSIPPRFRQVHFERPESDQDPSAQVEDVKLRFSPASLSMIRGGPEGEDWRLTSAPGGEFELSCRLAISDAFVCWILGFGEHVEVIRPVELRDAVRKQAERIAQLHSLGAK